MLDIWDLRADDSENAGRGRVRTKQALHRHTDASTGYDNRHGRYGNGVAPVGT